MKKLAYSAPLLAFGIVRPLWLPLRGRRALEILMPLVGCANRRPHKIGHQFGGPSDSAQSQKRPPRHLQHRLGHLRAHCLEKRRISLANKMAGFGVVQRAATHSVDRPVFCNQNDQRPFFVDFAGDRRPLTSEIFLHSLPGSARSRSRRE